MTGDLKLEREIDEARREISADGYPMSIGELTSMYKEGELVIRPEFQRFFRWSVLQKSRLIESILLGIPLPSIFVAQREDGLWEIVDGLQRMSTILQLQGELRDGKGVRVEPLVLTGTQYLPHLEGKKWGGKTEGKDLLTPAQELDIKRAKLDLKIIKRGSSARAKFDLFQRLNSYGSQLTSQELRSALLVAVSPEFFENVERLSQHPSFLETTLLSETLLEERYDVELVVRFLVLHNWSGEMMTQTALRDLPQVLDEQSVEFAQAFPKGFKQFERVFTTTFDTIMENGADEIFRRWDAERQEFRGSFLNTAFEVFALGLGYHIANRTRYKTNLIQVARNFWEMPVMAKGYATGRSTEARLVQNIPMGRKLLSG